MAITESRSFSMEGGQKLRRSSLVAARGSFLLTVLIFLFGGCGPPQIGVSKDAFKAVDALYTAVGLRDVQQLDRCAARLKSLQEQEKLPEDAAEALSEIIASARGGAWEPAQEELSRFMEGQRR